MSKFHSFRCIVDYEESIPQGEYLQASEPQFTPTGNVDCYTFFGHYYDQSVWLTNINYIFCLAEKSINQLEQAARKTDVSPITNYNQIRNYVCEVWFAARHLVFEYGKNWDYIQILQNVVHEIKRIMKLLTTLNHLPEYVLFNSKNEASYNYIHLYLDLKWLTLTLLCEYDKDVSKKIEHIESSIKVLFNDLIYVAFKKYEKGNEESDIDNGGFLCSCFKEMWLLLQLFIEETNFQGYSKDFWTYFNASLKEVVNFENSTESKESLFCISFFYSIAKLQAFNRSGFCVTTHSKRIKANFSMLELCVKALLKTSINEYQMRNVVRLLSQFQNVLWVKVANIDLLNLLWEFYYKAINTSFLGADKRRYFQPRSKFYNFYATLKFVKGENKGMSSYEYFLYMLMRYIKNNSTAWPKFKGRIYSKISPSKLASFNENGLQNFVLLFLILTECVNFIDVMVKLLSILKHVPEKQREQSPIVWSAHITLIVMYIKKHLSIRDVLPSFLDLVNKASADRKREHLMQIFVDGLVLIEQSSVFESEEHLLFCGQWLGRYLQWCPHSDIELVFKVVGNTLKRLRSTGVDEDWNSTFVNWIVPQIIELAQKPETPIVVAEVGGLIASIDGQRYCHLIRKLTGDNMNKRMIETFLKNLLRQSNVHQIYTHQTILIQAWIKLSLLTINHESLSDVSELIVKLPQWGDMLGFFTVQNGEDPFHAMIKFAGGKIRDAKTVTDIANLKRWFESYFGKMDEWVMTIINIGDRTENNRLLLKIYTSAALLFIHCVPALYTKNKTTSLFHRLVSTMLLPTAILLSKRPPDNMLAAMKISWHMFVRGIMRLDYRNDQYIDRVLKDLVIRYIPYLHDSSSPIIRCLDSELSDNDTTFILEKIVSIIVHKSKSPSDFIPQAVTLLHEMIRVKANGDINKMKIFVKICTEPLLEQLMFVDNRTRQTTIQAFDLLKESKHFNELRSLVKDSIVHVTDQHLSFHSMSIFQMWKILAKVLKQEVREIEASLVETVLRIEGIRANGPDNILRKGLQEVQQIIKS